MRNIWITVSYEGTNYAGFQRQPTRMTVQEMLENTLLQLTGKKTTIYFVARTDAGVHAYGQECTFYTESRIPQDRFVHAMNALLRAISASAKAGRWTKTSPSAAATSARPTATY